MHTLGPNDIIEYGVNGSLFDSFIDMADIIIAEKNDIQSGKKAHKRIMEYFTWNNAVDVIKNNISKIIE